MIPRGLLVLILAFGFVIPASAQGDNVDLLARLDQHSFYNDIWGYRAPDGTELVILGTGSGTAFIDATDPRNPVEIQFIGGPSSTWRDMKTYGEHCYIVTEGGGGMQIVSLVDPLNPTLVSTWGTQFWTNAHNVAIDVGAGILYACGTNNGNNIVDISIPTFPQHLGTYGTYFHDAMAKDGQLHAAEIYAGRYEIFDATNLPTLTSKDSIVTPTAFTHNVWVNDDNTIAVTTDETTSGPGHLGVYDISDPFDIQLISEWDSGTGSIIHNAFIKGDIVYCSYYEDGFVAIDISDPANPTKIGSYDTHGGSDPNYDGCWGCYPFQPSGAIYVSDMQSGLYILSLNALSIGHTPLTDTQDQTGPYTATATITQEGGGGPISASLFYSTDEAQNFTEVAMDPTGNPDEYSGAIPGMISPETVHYYIEASNGSGIARYPKGANDYVIFNIGRITSLAFDDFEVERGWTHNGSGQDDWQRGRPEGKAGDPSSAYSGNNAWANDLGASGWNGFYSNDVDNWLLSPTYDLNGQTNVRLRFRRWLTIEDGWYDQARIEVNGNEVWANPATSGGGSNTLEDTSWALFDVDISGAIGGSDDCQIRFTLTSDGAVTMGGWNIDDVEIYAVEPADCTLPEHYGTGLAGSGGFTPNLEGGGGYPYIGNDGYTLEGEDLLGGGLCTVFVGFARGSVPFKGGTLLVDLGQPFFLLNFNAAGPPTPGDGFFSLPMPIKDDPVLVGTLVDLQVLQVDPGALEGVSMSDGLEIRICDLDG